MCVSGMCVRVCDSVGGSHSAKLRQKKCKKFNNNFISIYKFILRPFLSKNIVYSKLMSIFPVTVRSNLYDSFIYPQSYFTFEVSTPR